MEITLNITHLLIAIGIPVLVIIIKLIKKNPSMALGISMISVVIMGLGTLAYLGIFPHEEFPDGTKVIVRTKVEDCPEKFRYTDCAGAVYDSNKLNRVKVRVVWKVGKNGAPETVSETFRPEQLETITDDQFYEMTKLKRPKK